MPEVEPISSEPKMPQYGSYRVLHPLGIGGMSSVYRAVHVDTGHEVALKVLPVHLARNPIVLQRFMREARSAESLEHPNIVSIYDRGQDSGRHYLVLEYVGGIDLHGYIQTRGPLGVAEAVRVIRHVAEGLGYAARRGLVHRDIKPSNILRSNAGEIKITDLGLALQWEFEDERVTREGTTVGTVDYMAPEQARDSRAAGPLSDLYSLGCTFYYLLAGIPPFPGGDITDKLTRHAQAKPPEIRDLRPDVPEAVSSILTRMMAKRPEERFASFDELILALDALELPDEADAGAGAVALVPLEGEATSAGWAPLGPAQPAAAEPRTPSSIPEISLASLPPEVIEPEPQASSARGNGGNGKTTGAGIMLARSSGPGRGTSSPLAVVPRPAMSATGWITLCAILGAFFVCSVVLIDRLVRSAPTGEPRVVEVAEPHEPDRRAPQAAQPVIVPPAPPAATLAGPSGAVRPDIDRPANAATTKAAPEWVEPDDVDSPPVVEEHYTNETLRKYLPAWALSPIPTSVEGPRSVVRRVPGPGEVSLRSGLDETKGTVEVADEGPFLINDFRVAGESRVIRAQEGFRTIIRVDRPTLQVVRSLPGVVVLEGKNLVLDSVDLILNLRDLSPAQDCLFYCSGANLTLRNCTITLVNAGNLPFALVRTAPADTRGCRIRFENTLVRGSVSTWFDLGPGPAEVVLRGSLLVGSQGPVVRGTPSGQRLSVLGSITACRGPAIDLLEREGGPALKPRPLVVRAFHSVFGRFQGAGIASVVACRTSDSTPREWIDWAGDRNLFCGWKGFYASGREPRLVLTGLADLRSTWNGSDGESQEIPVGWPRPQYPGQSEVSQWLPFVPGWEPILGRVAEARPFLGARTLWGFPAAEIPLPVVLTQAIQGTSLSPVPEMHQLKERFLHKEPPRLAGQGDRWQSPSPDASILELFFDAESAEWNGDLGAFLRAKIDAKVRRARIRVRGAGPRRFSPVRLPDGLVIEIRVEPPSAPGAEWLTWSPEPQANARALLELRGGSMMLSQFRLQDDPGASLQSLLHVEDGDVILHRCRLSGLPGAEGKERRLVSFTAAKTRPRSQPPAGLFVTPPDRPACFLSESILITQSDALRLELGRGMAVLSQSAIAAGGDAIELIPAGVARARFDADLVMEHCTLASDTTIIRLGPWPGREPGPDRPWLIQTDRCAYLGTYDHRVSDTVLLRADQEAMARGVAFWQAVGDAAEVHRFAALEGDPSSGRSRDVVLQWVNLWGSNHQREITGPRAGSNLPSVRLAELLKPGRVEAADLVLDPDYHPGRLSLDVGADLARQGIYPRFAAGGRRR
jgi:serine/threonine-protein kinase